MNEYLEGLNLSRLVCLKVAVDKIFIFEVHSIILPEMEKKFRWCTLWCISWCNCGNPVLEAVED